MDGQQFDRLSKWLVACSNSRRSALRALAAGAMAAAWGSHGLAVDAAKCKKDGGKCKKNKDCCSKKCKGGKCRCRALREVCTGTVGSAGNSCCGSLLCAANACGEEHRCCHGLGHTCKADCDCCLKDAQCESGNCCLGEGALCLFVGDEGCCSGLFCDLKSGSTCQPK
jgi:hypothetical protein